MYDELNKLDELSRRKFMQYSAKALLGVGLSAPMGNAFGSQIIGKPTAKSVIYIYLSGGMSHLETFDPKPEWDQQGPVQAIESNVSGIRVSEYLPQLAKRMNHMALIRSMTSNQGAHEPGTYFMHTSYTQRGTIRHPGLGAWLNSMSGKTNSTLPGNIRIGGSNNAPGGAGFLDAKYEPLHLGNPEQGLPYVDRHHSVDEIEMQERLALAQMMDLTFHKKYPAKQVKAYNDVYTEAIRLMNSSDLDAFNLNKEPQNVRARYGSSRFGKGCLLARRLVEHGVRFVEVTGGGWDTHDDNHDRVSELCNPFDQGVAALLDDLHYRGLLDETLVVIGTEFGRSPEINSNAGRNHHPSVFSCALAGGGIQGGQVYGASDERAGSVADNPVTVPDFNATIAYALGLPVDKVVYSPSGRPFTIADKGQPVKALF
ncbi:DUF1501 domain-containing protein [Coraliomargarita akajimensis]|uniref:DUF1501 domain-containing protein n=1 Tax=Coraliomargarita akajimensis (strain DSM 45221 / IAM 15411 / JCM 23193 / KCTC 12865 / 04OKA010-24) TaxID=583355 RepID=D5EL76_CORAD|nr:DUF1501 domain-containing protein [Coraliomargarita akajimensis]ADE53178.1 protein of unknown function DUF1501 [Coraliomargarita akajimensis DSM 45221]